VRVASQVHPGGVRVHPGTSGGTMARVATRRAPARGAESVGSQRAGTEDPTEPPSPARRSAPSATAVLRVQAPLREQQVGLGPGEDVRHVEESRQISTGREAESVRTPAWRRALRASNCPRRRRYTRRRRPRAACSRAGRHRREGRSSPRSVAASSDTDRDPDEPSAMPRRVSLGRRQRRMGSIAGHGDQVRRHRDWAPPSSRAG
jgi:hypothetical protein